MGPGLANNIRLCDGLTTAMSLWTFSDVFEEQGVIKQPFYGGFGLIAEDGIPKAAFNAFRLLHVLGNERIPVASDNAPATRDADGQLAIGSGITRPPKRPALPAKCVWRLPGWPVRAARACRLSTRSTARRWLRGRPWAGRRSRPAIRFRFYAMRQRCRTPSCGTSRNPLSCRRTLRRR